MFVSSILVLLAMECVSGRTFDVQTLNGAHLRVAGYGFPPFLRMNKLVNGIPVGIDTDVVAILAKKLNFTFEFIPTDNWGILRNGVWLGTAGKVFNQTSEIGIGHMIITGERIRALDISTPLYGIRFKFFTRRPRPLPQYFNIIKPFTTTSWLSITISIVLMPVVFLLLNAIFLQNANLDKGSVGLQLVGGFLGQAMADGRRMWGRTSGHLFFSVLFVSASFVIMFYECNLRAYLMSLDHEKPVDTAKDLVEQNRDLYLVKGATYETYMREAKSKYLRILYQNIVNEDLYCTIPTPLPQRMENFLDNGAAILTTEPMALASTPDMINKFGYSPFRLGNEAFSISFSGFAFNRELGLLSIIDPMLLHLKDTGVIQKVYDDNLSQSNDRGFIPANDEPLGMNHLLFANIILVISLVLSVLCFIAELLVKHCQGTEDAQQ